MPDKNINTISTYSMVGEWKYMIPSEWVEKPPVAMVAIE